MPFMREAKCNLCLPYKRWVFFFYSVVRRMSRKKQTSKLYKIKCINADLKVYLLESKWVPNLRLLLYTVPFFQ